MYNMSLIRRNSVIIHQYAENAHDNTIFSSQTESEQSSLKMYALCTCPMVPIQSIFLTMKIGCPQHVIVQTSNFTTDDKLATKNLLTFFVVNYTYSKDCGT